MACNLAIAKIQRHGIGRFAQVIRVVVSVNTFEHVLRDSEVTGSIPMVHSALQHRPGDRRAAQIVVGAMLDACQCERTLPGSLDVADTIDEAWTLTNSRA